MNDQTSEVEDLEHILIDECAEPIKISYAAIRHITKNFAQEIGHGGFGVVYLGGLQNGMVAVKKLYTWKDLDNQLFLGEVACLKKAKHKNIARFLAYCVEMQCEIMEVKGKPRIVEEQQRLLCFEYVPNGSLKHYLEGIELGKTHGYEWDVRYQIITGIFQGLQHLHQKRIYHLDLKPSNVLLGAHMEPKITDFGVSRCIDDGEQSVLVTKNIFGTPGYLAPECIDKQQISAKADIFSLGILMINILTGHSGGNIENWQENIDVDCSQKKICIELAEICIGSDPHNRPTIDEIIQKLNETQTMILKDPRVIREPRNDPESSLYQVVQRFQALSMQTLRENSRIDDIYMELNVLECILEGSKKPSHLSYRLLRFITENFSSERKVDTNLYTEMYKGILRSVAVQRLFTGDIDDGKFHQEVNKMMMMAQHRNIVRFLGYSSYREERQFEKEGTTVVADKCERLLCFEYLSKGRLDNYLSDASCGLEWKVRYQVIKGICEGLHHIHAKVLLHLDLKPANILLDDNMIPKIIRTPYEVLLDTKLYLDGSVGYLAPEFSLGNISSKSDIYRLGVTITEILTGQKESSPIDNVLDIWRQRLTMYGSVTGTLLEQVRVCAWISIACMDTDPAKRPNTESIINFLAQTEIMDKVEKSSSAMPLEKPLSVEEGKAGKVPKGSKQRIVIKVSMPDNKSRAKAFQLVAQCGGVVSVALAGVARDRLEVVGDGVDVIALVSALRRNLGHAEILQVGVNEEGSTSLNELPQPQADLSHYYYYTYPPPPPARYPPQPQYGESSDTSCSVM